jgi:hypothetical protein
MFYNETHEVDADMKTNDTYTGGWKSGSIAESDNLGVQDRHLGDDGVHVDCEGRDSTAPDGRRKTDGNNGEDGEDARDLDHCKKDVQRGTVDIAVESYSLYRHVGRRAAPTQTQQTGNTLAPMVHQSPPG